MPLDYVFLMFLTCISNFMSIRCYLLFNPQNYFLCLILDYKNLKFKYLIDDIVIDFLSFENFTSMKDIKRKYNPIVDQSKFTYNKKIISEVIAIDKLCLKRKKK